MSGGKKGRETCSTSKEDREQFIRDNAVQLVSERDARIERMRLELVKLYKTVRALRESAKARRR